MLLKESAKPGPLGVRETYALSRTANREKVLPQANIVAVDDILYRRMPLRQGPRRPLGAWLPLLILSQSLLPHQR
jgi:hypothetical protein